MEELKNKKMFSKKLLEWYAQSERPMPWKGEKNAYFIWLSEIILQQTRVEQGLPYFLKFKAQYPTVKDLANAPEVEVMKLWEGLGYYSRARNLHSAAKFIANDLNGVFPDRYEDILALKGVGPYTAAAIASFAYNLPYAVVDGNVYRVLSRFFGIDEPIDTTRGKKLFSALAQELLTTKKAGVYNQAIMDFGATHCMPKNTKCNNCNLSKKCVAFNDNRVNELPVKSKKIKKRERFFNYLNVQLEENTLITKRTSKDIWQNLYEFPLIESEKLLDKGELKKSTLWETLFQENQVEIIGKSKVFKQQLTHQKIHACFWKISLKKLDKEDENPFIFVDKKELNKFPFPKIIDWYLQDNSLYLELF